MNPNMARSQRWKLPLAVMPTRSSAATGTERYGLTPK